MKVNAVLKLSLADAVYMRVFSIRGMLNKFIGTSSCLCGWPSPPPPPPPPSLTLLLSARARRCWFYIKKLSKLQVSVLKLKLQLETFERVLRSWCFLENHRTLENVLNRPQMKTSRKWSFILLTAIFRFHFIKFPFSRGRESLGHEGWASYFRPVR